MFIVLNEQEDFRGVKDGEDPGVWHVKGDARMLRVYLGNLVEAIISRYKFHNMLLIPRFIFTSLV